MVQFLTVASTSCSVLRSVLFPHCTRRVVGKRAGAVISRFPSWIALISPRTSFGPRGSGAPHGRSSHLGWFGGVLTVHRPELGARGSCLHCSCRTGYCGSPVKAGGSGRVAVAFGVMVALCVDVGRGRPAWRVCSTSGSTSVGLTRIGIRSRRRTCRGTLRVVRHFSSQGNLARIQGVSNEGDSHPGSQRQGRAKATSSTSRAAMP